ncbi:MAG TPA: phosphomannose isomerase type II C-terminal cupin domain [Acidobacteriota bacterium]|nr:phosphomannose isomerase type II C-terminal cupin domain [Acidobacteriota bacterium]
MAKKKATSVSTETSVQKEKNFRKRIIEDHRPWGKFRSYPHKDAGSIKLITVKPNESLSLQYHNQRSEYWVILDKGLEVTVGEKVWRPLKNEEIYIPIKAPHRARNIGNKPARIMEIWIGNSDEKDIVRLKDIYGRTKKSKNKKSF